MENNESSEFSVVLYDKCLFPLFTIIAYNQLFSVVNNYSTILMIILKNNKDQKTFIVKYRLQLELLRS